MHATIGHLVALGLFLLLGGGARAAEREVPVSGKKVPELEGVDQAILDFMKTIGCQSATVAISRDGQLLYSRGFGWLDKARKKPVPPTALMRIASISKPITAAAIRNSVRAGRLSLDTKAFPLIAVKAPNGKVADARINDITVAHLLDHKGGWDPKKTFDPMFRNKQIE